MIRPAEAPLASIDHTYVKVTTGSVGTSMDVNTVAEWTQTPIGTNRAAGIVTSLDIAPGAELAQGSTLYSVGLRPVVAAEGDVPMFRPITAGTAGADVVQLQRMLSALGYYDNTIDGRVEQGTAVAIMRWQKAFGMDQTGVVDVGDVIFLPRLPTRSVLNPETIHLGATLVGGEDAILGLPIAPRFWIPVTDAQAATLPAGSIIEVTAPDGAMWHGETAEQTQTAADGTITVAVTGLDDSVLCDDACASIPVSGQTLLRSSIVTVERVDGLVVPSAALVTTAEGRIAVITVDGEKVPVEVVASAKGMSVVTGIADGTKVRVPASDESSE